MKKIFHKHQYQYYGKSFKGNEQTGHSVEFYFFRCQICRKIKKVKVCGGV